MDARTIAERQGKGEVPSVALLLLVPAAPKRAWLVRSGQRLLEAVTLPGDGGAGGGEGEFTCVRLDPGRVGRLGGSSSLSQDALRAA